MKKAVDVANASVQNAGEHTRNATALRQTAGRVRACVDADMFDDKERKVLLQAMAILEDGAKLGRQVAALKAKVERAAELRRKEVAGHIATTFGGIQAIEAKVALVAIVDPQRLKHIRLESDRDLAFYFDDSLRDLVWTLARRDGTPEAVVTAAWLAFRGDLPGLEKDHASIIQRLRRGIEGA